MNTLKINTSIDLIYFNTQVKNKLDNIDIIDLSECEYFCSAFLGHLMFLKAFKGISFKFVYPENEFLTSELKNLEKIK